MVQRLAHVRFFFFFFFFCASHQERAIKQSASGLPCIHTDPLLSARKTAARWPADRWLGAVDFLEHGNVPDDLSRSQANGSSGHLVLVDSADGGRTTRRVIPEPEVQAVLTRAWSDPKSNRFYNGLLVGRSASPRRWSESL